MQTSPGGFARGCFGLQAKPGNASKGPPEKAAPGLRKNMPAGRFSGASAPSIGSAAILELQGDLFFAADFEKQRQGEDAQYRDGPVLTPAFAFE